jgi:citrate lyase beta subunit
VTELTKLTGPPMRHFQHLPAADLDRLFSRRPASFTRASDRGTLAVALGATLYMPGTRPSLADDLARQAAAGVMSSVLCLEDAIGDGDQAAAVRNVIAQLRRFAERVGPGPDGESRGPLVFVRVRHPEQITGLVTGLGDAARVLSGFVLPKFTDANGAAFLDALGDSADATGHRLFAMPVIESPEVVHRETREETLVGVARLLAKHRDSVLAVRIGAADLCSAFGIRRSRDLTIYDVHPVAQVIADIVNVLGRADGTGHVVTGPVWEYFHNRERLFKPQLRQSPFDAHDKLPLRRQLIHRDLDGLIREVVLDRANGLTGKTVIHPTHVGAVHALSVVTHEEFSDAMDVRHTDASGGGVTPSRYGNKMNEARPHLAGAERILARAEVFGVAAEGVTEVDLLAAGVAS